MTSKYLAGHKYRIQIPSHVINLTLTWHPTARNYALLQKYYPTWRQLDNVIVETIILNPFEIWTVKSLEHGFTFDIDEKFLFETDYSKQCNCNIKILLYKGCRCGGE